MHTTWIRGSRGGVRVFSIGLIFGLCLLAFGCLPEFGIWPGDAGGGDGDADLDGDADGDGDGDSDSDGDADGDGDTDTDGDSDGDGEVEVDPCDGVDCSEEEGQGECHVVDGEAQCICNFGFDPSNNCSVCLPGLQPEDGECVPARECLPTTCAGRGECGINEDDEVFCTCRDGFDPMTFCVECLPDRHLSGDGCVENETCPPEEDACSGRGTCNAETGEAICTCDVGYRGANCESCYSGYHDEDGECVRDQTCLETTCSGHGRCALIDGVVTCECGAGYTGDSCAECDEGFHHVGLDCFPDDSCEGRDCSGHGRCLVEGGVARCICADGYRGEDCEDCYPGYQDHAGLCTIPICGDGFVDPGEECDEGEANVFNGSCLPTCREAMCGDGEVCSDREACGDLFEYCDDGNIEYGDECAGDCLDGERIIETVAGGEVCDGLPAKAASLSSPSGVGYTNSPVARVVIADTNHHRIRAVTDGNILTTIAGTGRRGWNGIGEALATEFDTPADIAVREDGVAVVDVNNHRIRLVTPTGLVSTLVGNGGCWEPSPWVSRIRPLDTGLCGVGSIDAYEGELLITDGGTHVVMILDDEGWVRRFAGNGSTTGPDSGPATSVSLTPAHALRHVDGRVFISDYRTHAVREVGLDSVVRLLVGLFLPKRAARFPDGDIIMAHGLASGGEIVRIRATNISKIAGGGSNLGDGVDALSARIGDAADVAVDDELRILVVDSDRHIARRFLTGSTIHTIAGNGFSDYCGDVGTAEGLGVDEPDGGWDYSARNAALNSPIHLVVLDDGTVVWTERGNHVIRMMSPDGTIDTMAGNGERGQVDGVGISARFCEPYGLAVDTDGTILVAETNGCDRVRRINPVTRRVTTIAGIGTEGSPDEGDLALTARLGQLLDIVVGSDGTIYLAEHDNNRVSRIDEDGRIWTYAGTYNTEGNSGDGGAAASARLGRPCSLGIDGDDNLYVGDYLYNRVRLVRPGDRPGTATIEAFAGSAEVDRYIGDGGPPEEAGFSDPGDIAVDDLTGSVFISDRVLNVIRVIRDEDPSDEVSLVIRTVSGTGACDYEGDEGPSTSSALCSPVGVAVVDDGGLYIADTANSRIRHAYFGGLR